MLLHVLCVCHAVAPSDNQNTLSGWSLLSQKALAVGSLQSPQNYATMLHDQSMLGLPARKTDVMNLASLLEAAMVEWTETSSAGS